MGAQVRWWWPKRRQVPGGWMLLLMFSLLALLLMIFLGYVFHWSWTGLAGKTLWDWLQMLIVPLVLAVGAFLFNRANSRTENRLAQDKQREDLLQAYLDRLSELLLKEGLRISPPEAEVRTVARVRTLAVLSQLDTRRKNQVLAFLREAKLVSPKKGESVITFQKADLRGADLAGVDLSKTEFSFADLRDADLRGANLSLASLSFADLSGADLGGAILRKTYLAEARVTAEQLQKALSLEQATLPDGVKHA